MIEDFFEGVAFDLEGTVIDVEFVHHKAHAIVAAEVGVEINIEDLQDTLNRIPHFIGGPDDKVAEDIYHLSNGRMVPAEIAKRKKELYDIWIKELKDIRPRPGFIEVLQRLEQLRIPIATGSLTATDQAIFLIERSGLSDLFSRDRIVLREDVKELKPAMDVYLETADRMGIAPTRQLVFEDSPNGVRAAITAGSAAVGMPVYNRPPAIAVLLEAGANAVFTDWREVNIDRLIKGEFS